VDPDVFIPVDNPKDPRYPPLTYVPGVLQPLNMGMLLLLLLLMLGALIYCVVWSSKHGGLLEYLDGHEGRYFLFRFLPQIAAGVLMIYIFTVEAAIFRVMPFIGMSSHSADLRTTAALMNMYPSNFLVPQLEHLRAGHILIGSCVLALWLANFTIPLISCLFAVRLVV